MEEDDHDFARTLRAARLLRGWSQADLAAAARVAPCVLADVELACRGPTPEAKDALLAAVPQDDPGLAADRPREGLASGQPLRWIEATDITEWGRTRDGQASLPELVRRLIRAEYGVHARLRFPSGDSVSQAGWDGQSLVDQETEFVPAGGAGWEIGAGEKAAKTKADEDWRARFEEDPPSEWLGARAETTLVVVTAHRWTRKDEWARRRREEGVWRDVRVLDAESLAHWIERHPAVAYWLAARRAKRPPDVEALSELWGDWASATDTPLSAELSLVGRDKEAADLVTWLRGPPTAIRVQADSAEEAAAFLHACIDVLPDPHRSAFLTRAIAPRTPEAARQLAGGLTSLILVLTESDPGLAATLARRGHHVFVAVGPEPGPGEVIVLGRPRRWELLHALRNIGLSHDRADGLSRDAGRSLTTLRRLMPPAPGRLPQWSATPPTRPLLAALLAGGWNADNAADRGVLEALSAMSYADFERAVTPHLVARDGPLRRTESLWRLKSPRDAWGLLARNLTNADVQALIAAAAQVFREVDPTYRLAAEERWMAAVRGVYPKHSGALVRSMAESLILLAFLGDAAPAVTDAPGQVARMVRDLLIEATGELWWSLGPVLPQLAEAAPEAFLAGVREAMAGQAPAIAALFDVEDARGQVQSQHIHLVWALERLAWDPILLPEVAEILAALVAFDPGGRNVTRPAAQLARIFLTWSPQTNASAAERRAVLDGLRMRHPEVAWQVMLGAVPVPGGILIGGNRAQWREASSDQRSPLTEEDLLEDLEGMGGRLAADVGLDVERWAALLEIMERLTPNARASIGEALLAAVPQMSDPAQRDKLRTALRKCLDKHAEAEGAWWAIPPEELEVFRRTQADLEPADPLWRTAWLFSNGAGGFRYQRDWRAAEDAARAARLAAVGDIAAQLGSAGVRALSEMAGRQDWVADAIFANPALEPWRDAAIADGLAADDGRSWTLARELLRCGLQVEGRAFVEPWLRHARADVRAMVRLLLLLRPGPDVWTEASQVGPQVDDAYWREVGTYALHGDVGRLRTAVTKLLGVSRPRAAASLVALSAGEAIDTDLIVQVLQAVLAQPETEADGWEDGYGADALATLFQQLSERTDADAQKVLSLEWAYFQVLINTKYPALRLRSALASDPGFVVQVLTLASPPDPESGVVEPPLDERLKPQGQQAWRILDACRPIAGSDANGDIDPEALLVWTREVRRGAAEIGRLPYADSWIGKTLAGARRDAQGPWPPAAVAAVLDDVDSPRLSEGFEIGALYPGGVTMRMPSDGGRQEKEVAARYQRDADALAPTNPVTARALRRIAEGYLVRAQREDQQAEHHAWST